MIHLYFVGFTEKRNVFTISFMNKQFPLPRITLLINFYFPQCWCPLPSNVASPVTTPAVASIVGSFSGLPSKTKENTNKDQMLS